MRSWYYVRDQSCQASSVVFCLCEASWVCFCVVVGEVVDGVRRPRACGVGVVIRRSWRIEGEVRFLETELGRRECCLKKNEEASR